MKDLEDDLAFALLDAQMKLHHIRRAAQEGNLAKVRKFAVESNPGFKDPINRWSQLRQGERNE